MTHVAVLGIGLMLPSSGIYDYLFHLDGLSPRSITRMVLVNQFQGISSQTPSAFQVIKPGESVGALRLGDTSERAFQLFPRKAGLDQELSSPPECGSELNWVDSENPKTGNVFIRFKSGRVFQIDSATTSFRTGEGITIDTPPKTVRRYYKDVRSYILSNYIDEAIGGRPLIYWIDAAKGIAFAFAYAREEHIRYLFEIIVFQPKSQVCSVDGTVNSPDKRELPQYSLTIPGESGESR